MKLFIFLFLLMLSELAYSEERDQTAYENWELSSKQNISGFKIYLQEKQIDSVVPLYQLLRTASMWKECKAEPFSVPPKNLWSKVESVLVLLKNLSDERVIGSYEVVSAYRNKGLNKCSGGAKHSAHTVSFAVDLIMDAPDAYSKKLCEYWKIHGAQANMGLSRYPSGRIHIDTHGYRTWGSDHTKKTSFCL